MTYKRLTTSCLDCRKEIANCNFSKHIDSNRCSKPYIRSEDYESRKNRSNCLLCGKLCKSFTSLTQHEIRCKGKPLSHTKDCPRCKTQFTTPNPKKKYCSIECSRFGRKYSEEELKMRSESMKRAVKNNPESYSGGYNRGRVKSIVCSNGFNVLGKWEEQFVEYCIKEHIRIEQPNTGFSYHWNGDRTYFPDFYLPDYDLWVEIKGLETDRDRAKWDSIKNTHNKRFLVIDKNLIHSLEDKSWCAELDSNQRSTTYEDAALRH